MLRDHDLPLRPALGTVGDLDLRRRLLDERLLGFSHGFRLPGSITLLYLKETKTFFRTGSVPAARSSLFLHVPEPTVPLLAGARSSAGSTFRLQSCRIGVRRLGKLLKRPLVTARRHPMKRSSRAWKKRGKMRWKWRKKRMRRRKREQKMRQR